MTSRVRAALAAVLLATLSRCLLPGSIDLHAADWPVWGRDVTRNPVSPEKNPPTDWDINTGRNVKWSAKLGSQSFGTPIVADGRVYIGTNNGNGYLERYPNNIDLGVLLCLRESDGEFLWQYSAEKHPAGRVHDWPLQGIGSSPLVEGDRLWFVSNRWEVVCLDTQGFRDKENDGPVVDEPVEDEREADIIWRLNMIEDLGVFPHGQGMGPAWRCSPTAYKNRLYVQTGNGVNESQVTLPKPEAPSLVCLDKTTGKVLWTDASPGANILGAPYSSPLVAEIDGRAQVIVPQADGWIRSFDALSGDLIWKFDINRKDSTWSPGGRSTRNNILATPVLYHNRIYIASGHQVEHGEGPGRLVCLDPTKIGDISTELAVDRDGNIIPHRRLQAVDEEKGERAVANPNSGVVWEFVAEGENFEEMMHRTIASIAISDGRLIVADFSGLVHGFDAETGRRLWYCDCWAAIIATPLIVDGYVYVGDEDGDVSIWRLALESDQPAEQTAVERTPFAEISFEQSIPGSPIYANGTLYVSTRSMLYAIANEDDQASAKADKPPGGHWPRWRGEAGNNLSTETDLLQEWPEEGPPLVWRADGLGEGIASVSIADGQIMTICQREEVEYVRALDEATGAHLWTAALGRVIRQSPLMRWLTQRAPTIDRDRVYAVSLLGEVVCLRAADGEELWRRSYLDEFGGRRPVFGYGDCPFADGERVICTPGGESHSVLALDRKTGVILWSCAVPETGRAAHRSGIVAEIAGVPQFVTFFETTMVGIAVDNGRLLWHDESSKDQFFHPGAPLVQGNEIVRTNDRGQVVRLLRVSRDDERFATEEIYSVKKAMFDRFHDNAFFIDDHIYGINNVTTCIEWKTGEILWQKRVGRRPGSAMWADGRFYVHTSDGLMKLVAVTPSGYAEEGSFMLADHEEMSGATAPVVAGRHLYVREDDRLFCYDVARPADDQPVRAPPRVELPELATVALPKTSSIIPAADTGRIPNSVFTPTPHDIVAKMLKLADIEEEDVVFDLGSGDGRIVIAAAKRFACRAIGYEIDAELVKDSQENAKDAGVEDRVTFHRADLFTADLEDADVVMLYLLPIQNERLIPKLKLMKTGARIVTHQFRIPGLVPDKIIQIESNESGEAHRIFLYTVPLMETQNNDRKP
ncbi:MAG: PQQ-binding-like beta-propeller repeat protein [Planctomycetaceae bacterium]